MTEIKRLSDEDIETLEMVHEEPVCTGCPIAGGICGNIIKESECHLNCHDVSKTAIRLEMDARERDKMEEKKQLPTESELRDELEKKRDSVSEINGMECTVKNIKWDRCFVLEVSSNHGTFSSGNYRYRPDIEPPAKNTVMIVHYTPSYMDGFFNFPVVSLGEITESGSVKFQFGPCDCRYAMYWYDPQTGNHSAGWDMEWIEGVE